MSGVHLVWLLVGLLWIGYWFRRLPVMMRRYVAVQELGEAEAERRLIGWQDIIVSALFLVLVLGLTAGIALWANGRYPITMPLQTGRVEAPVLPLPGAQAPIDIEIHEARFNLPRRTLTLDLTVANGTEAALAVGQFVAGYVRFTNGEVIEARREDAYDMVAPDSLSVSRQTLAPGASTRLTLQLEDAIWEEQRLVDIVAEPDLRIAGLLFFYDAAGNRYVREIGTRITPEFRVTPDEAEQLDNLQLVGLPRLGSGPDA
jgi:methane/ammonia monooxygenase subunit B